ncbi:MAG: STAS domain-containing protein [Candidatus Latescibacterota bacterium]|nr:MAG: STAS domain-containing protein [Candidatus Latescibacterota bacterium]
MKVNQKEIYGAVVLELQGKLTGGPEAETFRNIFKELMNSGKKNIIVNLKKVDWINSTGLGILISGYTSVRKAGGDLVLCNVGDRIDSILYVTKLNLLFQSFENEEDAAEHLRKGKE